MLIHAPEMFSGGYDPLNVEQYQHNLKKAPACTDIRHKMYTLSKLAHRWRDGAIPRKVKKVKIRK